MGFPKQEYWSGLPFPSPGDLPNPGIEPTPPALAGRFFTTEPPGKPMDKLQMEKKSSAYPQKGEKDLHRTTKVVIQPEIKSDL